jgi:hypothetical protein
MCCATLAKKLCLGAMQREVTMLLPRALRNRIRCDQGLWSAPLRWSEISHSADAASFNWPEAAQCKRAISDYGNILARFSDLLWASRTTMMIVQNRCDYPLIVYIVE